MSVPLDRLYNFLHDISKSHDILIYRYLPHGSRKIADCTELTSPVDRWQAIRMICHDQETLDYRDFQHKKLLNPLPGVSWSVLKSITSASRSPITTELHDQTLLLHSELNSCDLDWFEQNGAVGVYWWCHAVIARDWFRYAEHDTNLIAPVAPEYDFLVYNRAWAGLREYRLKFTELVIDNGLVDNCLMKFNPLDHGSHYQHHKFENPKFELSRPDLEDWFESSDASASASADYNSEDYSKAWVEVVLETVFDDTKQHLTEKALRPIAVGKPFIVVSTPGILKYLHRYGFKTFSECWDESYDDVQDPLERLEAVTNLMKKLSQVNKSKLQDKLQEICNYNRARFFSAEFQQQVIDEFKTNLAHAANAIKSAKSYSYFANRVNSRVLLSEEFTEYAQKWLKDNQ